MNITEIIDNGDSLILKQDINTNVIILKQFCKLKLANNVVTLFDYSTSNQANLTGEPQQYNLYFSKITNPATPDAIALENAIDALIQTGTGAGDATAANQLLEIAELQDINASTTSIDTKMDAVIFNTNDIPAIETNTLNTYNQLIRQEHAITGNYTPLTVKGVTSASGNLGTVNDELATDIDTALATIGNFVIIKIESQILVEVITLGVSTYRGAWRITYSSVN